MHLTIYDLFESGALFTCDHKGEQYTFAHTQDPRRNLRISQGVLVADRTLTADRRKKTPSAR